MQEFGGLQKVGDIYVFVWVGILPPIFCRQKDWQRRIPRQEYAAAATHNARRRCKDSISQILPSFKRCGNSDERMVL